MKKKLPKTKKAYCQMLRAYHAHNKYIDYQKSDRNVWYSQENTKSMNFLIYGKDKPIMWANPMLL